MYIISIGNQTSFESDVMLESNEDEPNAIAVPVTFNVQLMNEVPLLGRIFTGRRPPDTGNPAGSVTTS